MRLNITLRDFVVEDTDKRAAELGMSRSAYIAAALTFKAQYDDMMKTMPKMMEMMEQVKPHLEKMGKKEPASLSDGL